MTHLFRTLITAACCFVFTAPVFSQTSDLAAGKGTFMVSLGWEGGLYFNDIRTNLFGYDSTYSDTAGAVFFPVALEYCFSDRLSAGLLFKGGRYIEDNDYEENSTSVFDVFVNVHLLKKTRNDLYIRGSIGGSRLEITNSTWDSRGVWGGLHAGLALGYRHFFGEHFGFYLQAGSASYNLQQKSLTAGNTTIDEDDLSYELDLRGWEFGLGLMGRF